MNADDKSIIANHAKIVCELHDQLDELKSELVAAYQKESKILTILASRDEEIEKLRGGEKPVATSSTDKKVKSPRHEFENNDLLRRYEALSSSKLGKIQLSYWKLKSKKKGK
ncbi:hypothetical protein GCM10027417_27650 [Glutamicibacter endophyticus]